MKRFRCWSSQRQLSRRKTWNAEQFIGIPWNMAIPQISPPIAYRLHVANISCETWNAEQFIGIPWNMAIAHVSTHSLQATCCKYLMWDLQCRTIYWDTMKYGHRADVSTHCLQATCCKYYLIWRTGDCDHPSVEATTHILVSQSSAIQLIWRSPLFYNPLF